MDIYFKESLKQYFKAFRIPFIIFAVILAAYLVCLSGIVENPLSYYDSPNTERVYGSQRVFDYGNQLTDTEEALLEEYIAKSEKQVCCDIVIVTLDESLKNFAPEYKAGYSMVITPDIYVMVYADKFWEDNKFGYDSPQVLDGTTRTGDGVILVDNLHREEETGKIYTWMGTTGIVEEKYSSAMIDRALDVFYEDIEYDYYGSCKKFIDRFVKDMGGKPIGGALAGDTTTMALAIAGFFVLIFYLCNFKSKAGKVTVTNRTYLVDGSCNFVERSDIFLRKSVTKHYNPPQSSSSGGGGGHHSSGGGGSHGGGGHSR